jgi:pantoate--beta-alanine ligase
VQSERRLIAVRTAVRDLRADGGTVALVPTMGALHDGHLSLVARAREVADHVVASIFVNPTQFGEGEDLAAYPRPEEEDRAKLAAAGCDLLWAPTPEEVYPSGFSTSIRVSGVTEGLCGGSRPGHFDGVAVVVAKLFNQIQPDYAMFGEKDYQQLALIRRMARDLDFGVEIIGVPTVREADGLALSSRNAYLTDDERTRAVALPKAMAEAAVAIIGGESVSFAIITAKSRLFEAGFATIDYIELRDAETLDPVETLERPARLLAAAWIGKTRLIDNIPLERAGATISR